jgi:hypothetical protein
MFENLRQGNLLGRLFGISLTQINGDPRPDRIGYWTKDKECFVLESDVELKPEKATKDKPRTFQVTITPRHLLQYTKAPSATEFRTLVVYNRGLNKPMELLEPHIDNGVDPIVITGLDRETADYLTSLGYYAKIYIV